MPIGRVAVLVAAWRASRWIEECLVSIEAQADPAGFSSAIYVASDGCAETRAKLLELGRPHFASTENVGPYIIRNSLAEIALAEGATQLVIFDADDRMLPGYLKKLCPKVPKGGILGAGRIWMDDTGRRMPLERKQTYQRWQSGVCLIDAGAWERLGGYRPDRVASDIDLVTRARYLRLPVKEHRGAMYERRMHRDQITQSSATGRHSAHRIRVMDEHAEARKRGEFKIEPKTTTLIRSGP